MTCADYDALIASLISQINDKNAQIAAKNTDITISYAQCCVDDTLPGGPLQPPLSNAAVQNRINALQMFLFNPQTVQQAQKAINDYQDLLQKLTDLQMLQTQLSVLNAQLSQAVMDKFNAGCQ